MRRRQIQTMNRRMPRPHLFPRGISSRFAPRLVYAVHYRRAGRRADSNAEWWMAHVFAIQGCATQGRTLGEARAHIREVLGLFVEDADHAVFSDTVDYSPWEESSEED